MAHSQVRPLGQNGGNSCGRTKQHRDIAHVLDLNVVISNLGPKVQLWGFGLFSSDCVDTAMSTISH